MDDTPALHTENHPVCRVNTETSKRKKNPSFKNKRRKRQIAGQNRSRYTVIRIPHKSMAGYGCMRREEKENIKKKKETPNESHELSKPRRQI